MMRYSRPALILLAAVGPAAAQPKPVVPDLKAIAAGKGATVPADLKLEWVENVKGRAALRVTPTKTAFDEKDEWAVVLDNVAFADGVIEFAALGQSGPPQSNFLGAAFRVADGAARDAVYFRPFNFRAGDAARAARAVQYISHPKHPWYDLRRDEPGRFEKPAVPAPDGDAWFRAKIVVARPKVRVYIDGAEEPSLAVEELSGRTGGGVGLWVGPGRGGYFADLKITPAK